MKRHLRESFDRLVRDALETVPARFQRYLDDVSIEVEDRPTRELLEKLGIDKAHTLFGVYMGEPLTLRSVEENVRWPSRIVLFRENILSVCRSEADAIREIRTTVLHEIGHHFGMTEEDLDDVGFG